MQHSRGEVSTRRAFGYARLLKLFRRVAAVEWVKENFTVHYTKHRKRIKTKKYVKNFDFVKSLQ